MTKILFIELLGGLGDVLIALPAIQALAASHTPAHLTVLTFAFGNQLLAHHLLVQQVWSVAPGQARQAAEQALQHSFDLVVTDTTYDGIAALVEQSNAGRKVINLWRSPPADQRVSDRMLHILQAESLVTPAAAQAHRHPRLHLSEAEQVQAGSAQRHAAPPHWAIPRCRNGDQAVVTRSFCGPGQTPPAALRCPPGRPCRRFLRAGPSDR